MRKTSTFSAIARSTVAPEGGELPLALSGRLLAQVGVTGAEMDVRGVEQSKHPVAAGLLFRPPDGEARAAPDAPRRRLDD